MKKIARSIHTATIMLLGGCATSTAVPLERITSAEAAVRTAEQVPTGSPRPPSYQHHLKLANEELMRGKKALDDGDERRAEMLFIRARTDAELAQAIAQAAGAKQGAERAREQIRALETAPVKAPDVQSMKAAPPAQPAPELDESEDDDEPDESAALGERAANDKTEATAATETPPIPDAETR